MYKKIVLHPHQGSRNLSKD